MFEVSRIIIATISAAAIVLAVAVYRRAPDRVWNRLYAVHALAVAGWTLCNYFIQCAASPAEAAFWIRATHPVVAVVICTFLDFAWVFPDRIRYVAWPRRAILYGTGLLFGVVGLAPGLLTSVELARGTVLVEYGPPFVAFGLFTVATLGWADYVMYRKTRRLRGLQRVQVSYVLTGLLVSQTIAVITMVLLPLVWGNAYYSRWGSAAYIFTIGAMAYALAKEHILGPKVALRRVVALLFVVIPVLSIAFIALTLSEFFIGTREQYLVLAYMLTGLFMGFAIYPLHTYVSEIIAGSDTSEHKPQEAFNLSTEAILRTLDIDELMERSVEAISEMLQPDRVSIFLQDEDTEDYLCRVGRSAQDGQGLPANNDFLPKRHMVVTAAARSLDIINRDEIFRFSSLEVGKPLADALDRIGAQIVAPLRWEDELIGLIVVSPNRAGEMYQREQIEQLRGMIPLISLALQNANLYAEVASTKEYIETILREMDSGVIAAGGDGRIFLYNRAAERMLGRSQEQVMDQHLEVLPTSIARCLRTAVEYNQTRSGDRFDLPRPGQNSIPLACSTSALTSATGQRGGAVAVINDLTVIQQLEDERQRAERLELMRVLTAGMAHEIRNPLVAIRTFAELLPTRLDDEEFRSTFMATATDEIEQIDQLVGQLLSLSKPAHATNEVIKVNEVCQSIVRSASAQAEAKEISLTTNLADISAGPIGDERRVHQAIVNLVNNALEAEPQGGTVQITTEQSDAGDGGERVLVRVSNPGSYIPPEKVDKIFKPFYTDRPEGTGLGLAICQTIIEEHGGTLEAHSQPDTGTEFVIALPLLATARDDDGRVTE